MAADKDKNKKKRDPSKKGDGAEEAASKSADETVEPVVRDKRRIDPETGEARVNADEDMATEEASTEETPASETISDEDIQALMDSAAASGGSTNEHLNDLKRVQAEYANYRKRVERDRYVARELAIAEVMTGILPILDDLELAQAHGDLKGSPLELVGQKIRVAFERYGLVQVGAVGELFDPKLHEAIAQLPSKDATEQTIADVVLPGYLLGERLLRAAKVAVSVPED